MTYADKLPHWITIGASWGGVQALTKVFKHLPKDYPFPILVVLHQHPNSQNNLRKLLQQKTSLVVMEIEDKQTITNGGVFLVPPNYHVFVEPDLSLSLSSGPKVHFCRPAIDLLFDSAANYHGKHLTGILLTGANKDGSLGLQRIQQRGGTTLVQDPTSAEAPAMPRAALKLIQPDYTLHLSAISDYLLSLPTKDIQKKTEPAL